MRCLLFLSIIVALLAAPPVVQAGTVTTNDYSGDSTAADIDESCKNLDLDSKGTLTGTCNPGTQGTSVTLESYAECVGGTLQWGTGGFITNLSGADIGVSSDGKKYLLTGTCTSDTGVTDTAVDTLQLDEKIKNSRGVLIYSGSNSSSRN